jgi:hypothetical protein
MKLKCELCCFEFLRIALCNAGCRQSPNVVAYTLLSSGGNESYSRGNDAYSVDDDDFAGC